MASYLVDLDGTIIDPKAGLLASVRGALRAVGRGDLASRDLDWMIGPPVIASLRTLLGDGSGADEALGIYRRHYATSERLLDFSVYPGVLASLAALRDEGQMCICTMKPSAFAVQILAELNLPDALFGVDLDRETPTKDVLLRQAVRELSLDPSECLVIGDRGSDMAAARETGMRALGVTWGYGAAAELRDAGAHDLCQSPVDLARAARRLMSA